LTKSGITGRTDEEGQCEKAEKVYGKMLQEGTKEKNLWLIE
jgi:hypothetical protein